MPRLHKEWYSRGYLPHFDHSGLVQMLTFHLADALPPDVVAELARSCKNETNAKKRRKVEAYLDAGFGSCYLRDGCIASMVQGALLHFDTERYRLFSWVVMPNHVHALLEIFEDFLLCEVLQSWKSYTSKEANRLLEKSGRFWEPEYFDRFIRNSRHFECAVRYIHENPVRAGLVSTPEEWEFSSAAFRKRE
jgi:putative transposase